MYSQLLRADLRGFVQDTKQKWKIMAQNKLQYNHRTGRQVKGRLQTLNSNTTSIFSHLEK